MTRAEILCHQQSRKLDQFFWRITATVIACMAFVALVIFLAV